MAARRTHNSTANLDPYRVPWFADCAPSLLTNRTIRRYLDAYSEHKWPEVIKLTLIYGVLGLEQQFPGGSPSIPQLRALVEKGGAQLVVERNLPGLQRQILNLQTGLDAVFDRLAVEAPSLPAPHAAAGTEQGARAGLQQQQQLQLQRPAQQPRRATIQQPVVEAAARVLSAGPRPASALNPGPVAPKAPDTWRRGEPTGFPSPPRATDHPLRRSLDNQGATNPIYPDWWLAAGPPEPPAPKQVARKQPRKQPRLAYSIQQQHAEASAAADDLVTAEYLMLPGSGYGQQQPEPVVAGEGPPVTLTTLTAEGSTTRTLGDAAAPRQPPAAGRAGAAGSRPGAAAAARRPQAVPSKIREAVAASRRRAASQQQHRQQLLASAVAAGSSLFGAGAAISSREQPQARHGPGSAAAEAVAACAPAAAADHFLSNPWTSCFLQPSAGGQAVGAAGFAQLPAADISPDDEARLAALREDDGPDGEEGHVPGAPAAYAVLQEVVAEQAAAAAVPLGGEAGQEHWGQLQAQAAAAEAWLRQEEEEEQLQQAGAFARSSCSSRPKGSPDAGSSRPRGVFADITSGLNSRTHQQGPGSSAAQGAPAPWLDVCAEAQEGRGVGAASSQQGVGGSSVHGAADDWRTLPLIDDEADLQQQGLGQQQQPVPAQRHRAWACDYGHLEGVAPPPAKAPGRQRRASGKPHKRWSETWVGDFGHLQEFPRFPRAAASEHEGQPGSEAAEGQPPPPASSKLLMSPADLQALMAAAGRLADQQAAALTHTHTAAAEGPGGANSTGVAAAGSGVADSLPSGPAPGDASRAHSLTARFAELLSRWDAQASAADLPAGVAARASVSYATHAVQPAAAEPAAAAAAAAAAAVGHTPSSPEQPAAAGSDHGSGSVDLSTSYASAEQSDDASAPAAGDASGLLSDSQQAASELSAAGGEGTGADSASEAATSAAPPQAALLSAGFEASQEGRQMLAQALDRHDAIMQLIASLGAAPGSDEGLLASATPSGSELTL